MTTLLKVTFLNFSNQFEKEHDSTSFNNIFERVKFDKQTQIGRSIDIKEWNILLSTDLEYKI